jgi:hypothetical protein
MVMRYDGGGVGHRSTRDTTQGASTTEQVGDSEESNELEADLPADDADGEIDDENDLYDWGYANEDDDGDVIGVEGDAPVADEEPIDEYDDEGYAPL